MKPRWRLVALSIGFAGMLASRCCFFVVGDSSKGLVVTTNLADFARQCPIADGFDFPVGGGSGHGYYDAQPFGTNNHLGEDWNGLGGGNTDFDDPVVSIGHGLVVFVGHSGSGWGNIVRVVHNTGSLAKPNYVESLYAHLNTIDVAHGSCAQRGEVIGTIGDADGRYMAHLHFEIREKTGMGVGGGYGTDTDGYLNPSRFVRKRRPSQ